MILLILLQTGFSQSEGKLYHEGEGFIMRAGEMVLQRTVASEWEHHLQAARAMGLNTIALTLPWNQFEKKQGVFNFHTPENNIKNFLQLCLDNELHVLLRPGPYVGNSIDAGGLPAYILDRPDILRSTDSDFKQAYEKYFNALLDQIEQYRDMIVMIQLDNQYSVHSPRDDGYYDQLAAFWREKNFENVMVSDPEDRYNVSFMPKNVILGMSGRPGSYEFSKQSAIFPNSIFVASDVISSPGLDFIDRIAICPYDQQDHLNYYTQEGISFVLSSFAGGSNFGELAGSINLSKFSPRLTQQAQTALLTEQGSIGEYYQQYRDILQQQYEEPLPDIPENQPIGAYGIINMKRMASIWDQPLTDAKSETPLTFEKLGQNQGIVIYSTIINHSGEATIEFEALHDYAQIYLDEKLLYIYNRTSDKSTTFYLGNVTTSSILEILIVSYGHLDSGSSFDPKGIIGTVLLNHVQVNFWKMRLMPLTINFWELDHSYKRMGGIFSGSLILDKVQSTFLDVGGYKRAFVYINGQFLGRILGSSLQTHLYCPAQFLMVGENDITVLDLESNSPQNIISTDKGNDNVCQ